MALEGKLIQIGQLGEADIRQMLRLMKQFYDNLEEPAFYRDLSDKDTCILLRDENGALQGFSTQRLVTLELAEGRIHGVFSGDTIIHPRCWGSLELYRVFARHFCPLGEEYADFYWFLISKGYKTYKMLPTFFREYYPGCLWETPERESRIMDAFGVRQFPSHYNPATGVLEYNPPKDRLKPGVADVGDRQQGDRHTAFFLKRNPGYALGQDLVCLARLQKDNLLPRTRQMLFGREAPV